MFVLNQLARMFEGKPCSAGCEPPRPESIFRAMRFIADLYKFRNALKMKQLEALLVNTDEMGIVCLQFFSNTIAHKRLILYFYEDGSISWVSGDSMAFEYSRNEDKEEEGEIKRFSMRECKKLFGWLEEEWE